MIDPNDVTNFRRTDDQLMEFWLFCLFVRGKNADVQAVKLDQFIDLCGGWRGLGNIYTAPKCEIERNLRAVKAGQYGTLTSAIHTTLRKQAQNEWFLRHASISDLEAIHGVGPKTARYFILHTRAKARVAALDTHILQFLGDRSGQDVPKTTPPAGRRYEELEQDFLFYADFYGVDPAGFDLAIWQASRESYPMDWHRYYEGVKK